MWSLKNVYFDYSLRWSSQLYKQLNYSPTEKMKLFKSSNRIIIKQINNNLGGNLKYNFERNKLFYNNHIKP